ncbi:MAG: sulfite exporter TauE/SafE family protein [Eubacterium sp.]|nr:sulfite exporter TauE/SafE family protein [Eubacterium sp.]
MVIKIYSIIVVLCNSIFAVLLFRKVWRKRREMSKEPGNPFLLALYSMGLQFLAAFGVSDFSVSIIVYKKFRLVEDKNLPGTLMNCCVIPVAVMAVGYLSVTDIDPVTLIVCVISGLLGALAGTSIISKMKSSSIHMLMIIALAMAAGTLLIRLLGLIPPGGSDMGFSGWKLVMAAIITFVLSGLSMGGFAVTALLLCFFYIMGLNPLAAFPLAMGTVSLACAFGGSRYVAQGNFNKKLALLSTVFGSLGAFIAVHFVKNLNTTVLQWAVLAVVVYSTVYMITERCKGKSVKSKSIKRESVKKRGIRKKGVKFEPKKKNEAIETVSKGECNYE